MAVRWIFAAVHLLGLGMGLGGIWGRYRALRRVAGSEGTAALPAAFAADGWWGVAAILWIGTGLYRLFGQTEKAFAYYTGSSAFWIKMGLLTLILATEIWPMVTLIRWRIALAKGQAIDLKPAAAMATISAVQAGTTIAMVLAATAMARGLGGS